MASAPTNGTLHRLLALLGFETRDLIESNHRVFRHLESNCIVILPDNRDDEPARQADILGLRDHLAFTGHLEEAGFDTYLREGKLPAA